MGNGIAHTFAQNEYAVNLVDVSSDALQRAIQTISKNLDRQIKKELITQEQKEQILLRVQTHTTLEKGLEEVDLVVEAATENLDIKLKLFKDFDQKSPEKAILASNTSSTKKGPELRLQQESEFLLITTAR